MSTHNIRFYGDPTKIMLVCLFVLGFYGSVNSKVMSSRSVNSRSVPGQA